MQELTKRQQDIANLIVQGYEDKEIAKELKVSLRTIKANNYMAYMKYQLVGESKRIQLAIILLRASGKEVSNEGFEGSCLTPKERQVALMVAAGYTNPTIGLCIGTTEGVVKNYTRFIYDKLGVWNRLELTIWAYRHGLLNKEKNNEVLNLS